MDSSENLYNILFEISNKDRYDLIKSLLKKELNLSQLARIHDLNLSETRRHLSRLTEVGLIQKNIDGTYRLANFGLQILTQIDNINFLNQTVD